MFVTVPEGVFCVSRSQAMRHGPNCQGELFAEMPAGSICQPIRRRCSGLQQQTHAPRDTVFCDAGGRTSRPREVLRESDTAEAASDVISTDDNMRRATSSPAEQLVSFRIADLGPWLGLSLDGLASLASTLRGSSCSSSLVEGSAGIILFGTRSLLSPRAVSKGAGQNRAEDPVRMTTAKTS